MKHLKLEAMTALDGTVPGMLVSNASLAVCKAKVVPPKIVLAGNDGCLRHFGSGAQDSSSSG